MRRRRTHLIALAGAFLLVVSFAACGGPRSAGDWPDGALLVARTEALALLLDRLASVEGTPLARRAAELRAKLPECPEIGAHAAGPEATLSAEDLRCISAEDPLAALRRREPEADLIFALPIPGAGTGSRIEGELRRAGDDATLDLRFPGDHAAGALSLLVPGERAAGPDVLASSQRLAHLRLRPEGGLDIASLIPPDSQADRMFRLRSQLFAGAVLDGTWEIAIYMPEPQGELLRGALALGFTVRSAAVAAANRFLADLEATWPLTRRAFAHPNGSGACLEGLELLPGFAPCYAATDRALVVGWNPNSLVHALAGPDPTPPGRAQAPARLELDFGRLARADAIFARRQERSAAAQVGHWPWGRARATGGLERGVIQVRVSLEGDAS